MSVVFFLSDCRAHLQVLGLRESLMALVPSSESDRRKSVAAKWAPSPHPIWLRPGTSDVLTFKQVLLEGEYDFPLESSPQVIVDAGAHLGCTSIWFATKYPSARIIAIEPEPANFELLVRNLAPFPNVTPVNAALWSHQGVVAIDDPGTGTWGFRTAEIGDEPTSAETVECLTVPDLMQRFDLDRIDLLKIDIEGAEKEVFSDIGASGWITNVDAIEVELHDRFRPGCSRAFFSQVGDFKIELTRGMNTFVARG